MHKEVLRSREEKLALLQGHYDVLVIGGGATGLGIAVDAATRGYRVALVEANDFAQATSSRSTKLVHGGVRYLASGQISLVYEALHERRTMLRSAPHLVHPLAFLTPAYSWWELPWYGAGLLLYNLLAGRSSFGPTKILGARRTKQRLPGIATEGLKGSVLYHDGQFDDARFGLALARTAEDHGAVVLNYVRCTALLQDAGKLCGATLEDAETGTTYRLQVSAVINATGIFVDALRQQDTPGLEPLLSVSRGTHIVVDASFLQTHEHTEPTAIMVPKTRDGRIIFAIPWLGKAVIGTTDLPAGSIEMEPGHTPAEIEFLLETVSPYLARPVRPGDVLSVFSGLRPLVSGKQSQTSKLSREHHIEISTHGLVTVAGGKWTTYRRMAQDALDFAITHGLLTRRECVSKDVALHAAPPVTQGQQPSTQSFTRYGTDASKLKALSEADPALAAPLDESLPYCAAEVVFAVREEMARTVEDVLSRRTRSLVLDARAAQRAAPLVARVMAGELGRNDGWVHSQVAGFQDLAAHFYEIHARQGDDPRWAKPE